MRIFWTEKGAELTVEGKALRFVDRKGNASLEGTVIVHGPAAGGTEYLPKASPIAPAVSDFLRSAKANSPPEVYAWFPNRKYSWPAVFCEALRLGSSILFIHAPKPSYWYVLRPIELVCVRFDDEAKAIRLLARMNSECAPELLSVRAGMNGTYAHTISLKLKGDNSVDVAATWVGKNFAQTESPQWGPMSTVGYTLEPCESIAEAASRFAEWLVDQLIATRPLYKLELQDKQLVLDKETLQACTAELKNTVKSKKPSTKSQRRSGNSPIQDG